MWAHNVSFILHRTKMYDCTDNFIHRRSFNLFRMIFTQIPRRKQTSLFKSFNYKSWPARLTIVNVPRLYFRDVLITIVIQRQCWRAIKSIGKKTIGLSEVVSRIVQISLSIGEFISSLKTFIEQTAIKKCCSPNFIRESFAEIYWKWIFDTLSP